jgi:hypothetical protein
MQDDERGKIIPPFLFWVGPILAQPWCLGWVRPRPKKQRGLLGRDQPNPFGLSPAQPTYFMILCIIYYNI